MLPLDIVKTPGNVLVFVLFVLKLLSILADREFYDSYIFCHMDITSTELTDNAMKSNFCSMLAIVELSMSRKLT